MDKSVDVSKVEKQDSAKETPLLSFANLEIFANTINHALIAITTFYATWYCVKAGWRGHFSQHTFISTIGYQVLMAEGILVMYKRNTYTFLVRSRETKSYIHVVLLAVGSILAIWGTLVEYMWREKTGRGHGLKHHRHAQWGLVSLIFLLPTILSGVFALFPQSVKRFLKPLFSKFSHNLFATVAFVTGMISTIQGYTDLRWSKTYDPGNFTTYMAWFLGTVTVLTMIGPVKTFIAQGRSFLGW